MPQINSIGSVLALLVLVVSIVLLITGGIPLIVGLGFATLSVARLT